MYAEVKLLSDPSNFAVVHLPTRQFPGVVFQGDTLHELVKDISAIERSLADGQHSEVLEEVAWLRERLANALTDFEQVCAAHKIELPYRN
jgi:hypothetical protein